MSKKARVDQLLVDRGLVESRTKAQALILAGLVFSGERKIDKAGQLVAADIALEVRGRDHPWVSRGGIKLAHGLAHFGWDVTGAEETDLSGVAGIPPPSRRILYRVEERLIGSRTINEFVPGIGFTRRYFRHNGTPMDHDFRLIEFRRGGEQPKPQEGT